MRVTSQASGLSLPNDFRNLVFNQAANGNIVFDAMLQWVGAATAST